MEEIAVIELKMQMQTLHNRINSIYEEVKPFLPVLTRNEYKLKSVQFDEMFDSMEDLKREMTDPKAASAIENNQRTVLKNQIAFESEMLKEFMKIKEEHK